MKKKLLLIMLFAWIGTAAIAQEGKKILSNSALQEIAVLKELASQITSAETNVATSSRVGLAEAQEKVNALYIAYEKELANQKSIHATDKKLVAIITEEELLVKTKNK